MKIIPLAVGKEKGKLKFDLKNEDNQTGWGGLSLGNNANSVDVDVVTLDDIASANNVAKIDVLKIDTEGADTWVLYGAKDLLTKKLIGHIYYEHNSERMKALGIGKDEAKKFLNQCGYVVEELSTDEFYAYPDKHI